MFVSRSKVEKTFSLFISVRVGCRKNLVLIEIKVQKKTSISSRFKGQKDIFYIFLDLCSMSKHDGLRCVQCQSMTVWDVFNAKAWRSEMCSMPKHDGLRCVQNSKNIGSLRFQRSKMHYIRPNTTPKKCGQIRLKNPENWLVRLIRIQSWARQVFSCAGSP
jgi:hypothetical protein